MTKVAEINLYLEEVSDGLAQSVAHLWTKWDVQRQTKKDEWLELRNFLFATDTSTTTNNTLPWKNKTTIPKLAQVRDNLHANYMSALFPDDDWLVWEGYNLEDEVNTKKKAITAYISNKTRQNRFPEIISKLVLDYIDYGNCFVDLDYRHEVNTDEEGDEYTLYSGPVIRRVSPLDIVFDCTARSFEESPNIERRLVGLGELKLMAEENPDMDYLAEVIPKLEETRSQLGSHKVEDLEKSQAYQVDGFGNLHEYLQSNFVEMLVAEGTFHDPDTGDMLKNCRIVVFDRMFTGYKEPIKSWTGKSYKRHVAWRQRPDNLWGMGPLDNLIGMQYRIDHLENLKADVFDLIAFPPLVIKGEVEEFEWGPNEEIHIISEDGSVEMLRPEAMALNADTQVALLEAKIEEFAGAPRDAMGIRTPGEKTAEEVRMLQSSASTIFQHKIKSFEQNLLEPVLNGMLEISRRNLDGTDVVRVMDDDLGVADFLNITKEDLTAKGVIRPVGARHFTQRAGMLSDINGILGGPMGQLVAPHMSGKVLAKLVEDALGLARYGLVMPHAGLYEEAETQQVMQEIQQVGMEQNAQPI